MFKPLLFILLYYNLFTAIAQANTHFQQHPTLIENHLIARVKEYIYRVPSKPEKTVTKKTVALYRVSVPGDCKSLLMRVKKVEPGAFVQRKKGFIQVGLFKKSSQAEQSVKKLANVGLLAMIVKIYP